MSEPLLSISRAAEACGISAKSIRYYEEVGLIPKAARHNGAARTSGNRLYSDDDLRRLRFVGSNRALGLSLADIAELLALSDGKGCPGAQLRYRSRLEGHLAAAQRGGLAGRCGCSDADARASSAVIRLFARGAAPLASRVRGAA